jgi:hypothetical protein
MEEKGGGATSWIWVLLLSSGRVVMEEAREGREGAADPLVGERGPVNVVVAWEDVKRYVGGPEVGEGTRATW